jgi:putative phosphoesterase
MQSSADAFDKVAQGAAALKEPEIVRYPVSSVAVLSDVHGNVHALQAVLAELEKSPVDLVVFSGDITWGPFPQQTVEVIRTLRTRVPTALVRGNADRALLELTDGVREPESPRDIWMRRNHRDSDVAFLREVQFQVDVDVAGVGRLRVCHGSPRADIEAMTPETPMSRLAAACADVDADVLITGHTHIQFDRRVDGLRRVSRHLNPGSVGLPYGSDEPGAKWVRADGYGSEGFHFKTTSYDLAAHLADLERTDDPRRDVIARLLHTPTALAEMIEYAEARVFSD